MATRPRGTESEPDAATLRALTICQPYAEAVVTGIKTIETRTWATAHQGWLVVHAGGAWWRERTLGARVAEREAEALARRMRLSLPVAVYPRRAVVGLVWLIGCFPFDAATWEALRPQHGVAEPWRPGLIGWRLADPFRLPAPVPWPGMLGLFRIPVAALGPRDALPADLSADGG